MRIDLRDESRRRIGRIEVDPSLRPTRVAIADGGREVFLDWDTALDDAGRLRRCVACGCADLYVHRAFPQLTFFVVVLAFAGTAVGIAGYPKQNPWIFAALIVLLVLDVASFAFRKHRLVCYRCRTSYSGIEIARHHRPWDRATAERYPAPAPAKGTKGEEAAPGGAGGSGGAGGAGVTGLFRRPAPTPPLPRPDAEAARRAG